MAQRKEHSAASAPSFTKLNNVGSDRNGAKIIFASDDFFAVAENVIKDDEPVWKEDVYTEFGKWMDGWETRRKRIPGHDFCIIAVAAPSVISGFEINTAFFTGNHSPHVSLQAAHCPEDQFPNTRKSVLGAAADADAVLKMCNETQKWKTIVPISPLRPGYSDTCLHYFEVTNKETFTHIRLNLFPDGGIARLRMYGRVTPLSFREKGPIDLVSFDNGGECTSFSDAHFGHPRNLIRPGRAEGMSDGWETARRLDRPMVLAIGPEDGQINYEHCEEWCVLKLGLPGIIQNIVIDTNHFKGNPPDRVKIEGGAQEGKTLIWTEIVPFSRVKGHAEQVFPVNSDFCFNSVKLTVVPDGGISRVRVLGLPKILKNK